MAVKLDIIANVKGQSQVGKLSSGLNKLGTNATIASKRLTQLQGAAAKSRATFAALGTTLRVGVAASLAAVTFGIGKFVKDTFAAGKLTESLQVRFKLLFNSASEGAKAFEEMNKFAGKVPFSLEAIAAGSGNLAVISKDAGELAKILEITGNVAAATGLDFRQTAEQIQRAFAGGIAAADVFRERGVRAMLGFEAGAKVSIEETRKKFFEVFANGGQFSTATKEFESTLEAQVSFVEDSYFRFRQAAAQPLFAGVKEQVMSLVGNFKENDTQLKILAQTVGENLAGAFKSVENGIRFVARNIDSITTAFKIFIGLKLGTFIAGIAAQFILLAANIKKATFTMHGLNIAIRANPIGLLVTAIQIAVTVFVVFYDEIMKLGKAVGDFLVEKFKRAKLAVLEFISKLTIFPGTSEAAKNAARDLRIQLDGLTSSYKKLTKEQKGYFSGVNMDKRTSKTRDFADMPNPRGDMANADKIAADKKAKDNMALNERITTMNRHWIRDQATINANQTTYGSLLKSAGIEAKDISNTISTTWIDGIRQGNSLLENVKNTFRNILQTIAETIIKKGIELQIEKLFEFLGTKKLVVEKQITSEKAQQLALAIATAAVGGGSSFGSIFHANKGGMVPGGAPYTDRVPAMLTPGEVVIPRGQVGQQGSVTNNTINISGNVDQRAIDQIRSVISSSPSHVGGANKTFSRNTSGLSMRRK
jgi:hypothetical protein